MLELTTKSGKKITVTATPGANKPAPWRPSGNGYTVTVKVGRKQASFSFWDSVHNAQNGIACDIRGALACFASDAMAGKNATDALDIMDEFGYTDTTEARRVFKGVKQAEKQADRLGLDWDDLAELYE